MPYLTFTYDGVGALLTHSSVLDQDEDLVFFFSLV